MRQRNAAAVFIRDLDSRAMPPRYPFGEAAGYLGLAESTIRSWFVGMPYGKAPNVKHFAPVLAPAAKDLLSFYDIASAHVLMALKAKGLRPADMRDVIQGLKEEYPNSPYPLLGREFFMFGQDVVLRPVPDTSQSFPESAVGASRNHEKVSGPR